MFGNMKEMLKQAQNMKSQMKKIKKELESIEVEGVSANGACKVIMTADMKTQDVKIDETLLSSEAYVIENAVKVAVNDALEDAKDTSAKKLKAVTGGLTDGLPGF
ncbi:MAG: nucleoid-associated protein, YbaB/EbfC family [Candidatus Marinimicrobia bacterium]|jgi:DNA-binding YbaB/EbfC family protein|nr:nucleoid-associated protein, YbaB/EbfC family [Candidatus Neomarinimicrobiota bacterium]|tara:strand:- start:177 stop:491 length:315 start_codon:yes stop_codon:yes gene_type:complete